MNCSPDIWLIICSSLDNAQIEALSGTTVWRAISTFASSQRLWHARCESLVEHTLPLVPPKHGCWKRSYYLLLQHLHVPGAFFFCLPDELAVRILLHIGRDPSVCNNLALRRSCEAGYDNIVRLLLSHPLVDPRGCVVKVATPSQCGDLLKTAEENGHRGIVRLLLEDGRVDPSQDDSLLNHAIYCGYIDTVRRILEDGRVDIGQNPDVLRYAIDMKRYEIVQLLLETGRVDHHIQACFDSASRNPKIRGLLEARLQALTKRSS